MNVDRRSLKVFILSAGIIMFGCAGKTPTDIGVHAGRLTACPATPNCVISQGDDKPHHIDPFAYDGDDTAALETVRQVVQGMDGHRIVTQTDQYLHVEFRSKIMGFVDDVEFYLTGTGVIHVRSASRVGYSDFGVNRKRLEEIRKMFHARLSKDGRK
jgi:uncharacterized protein (DUF1499 family)